MRPEIHSLVFSILSANPNHSAADFSWLGFRPSFSPEQYLRWPSVFFTVRAGRTFAGAKVGASGCVRPDAEGDEDLDPGHGTAEAK